MMWQIDLKCIVYESVGEGEDSQEEQIIERWLHVWRMHNYSIGRIKQTNH